MSFDVILFYFIKKQITWVAASPQGCASPSLRGRRPSAAPSPMVSLAKASAWRIHNTFQTNLKQSETIRTNLKQLKTFGNILETFGNIWKQFETI
jgi:hypothetical protein